MKITMRLRVLGTLAVAGALALSGGPAMAASSTARTPAAYTCTGGTIPSGSYGNVTIAGPCDVAASATITIAGNVSVAADAMFDAQSTPATIAISGNVTAARGSLLGLGCQPPSYTGNSAHECVADPKGHSTISVGGNLTANDAMAVLLNGITVRGNVTLAGGGSEIPWSIKNNVIDGNVTITGQRTDWLGLLFNTIGQNATLTNIALSDPHPGAPGVYIGHNNIGRNLTCTDLAPGVSGGFGPTSGNVVGRNATGQCASLVRS